MEYLAHISRKGEKETLPDHLNKTASLAAEYASAFNNEKVGKQLGLIHDIGKRTEHFQNVLLGKEAKIDHAMAGGILYYNNAVIDSRFMRRTLSGLIAAHHSYLRCKEEDYQEIGDYASAMETMSPSEPDKMLSISSEKEYEAIKKYTDENGLLMPISKADYFNIRSLGMNTKEFYTRMLFSCLVDADYTAAASFEKGCMDGLTDIVLDPDGLLKKLKKYRDDLFSGTDQTLPINRMRGEVYTSCCRAGKEIEDLLYTLTAPTGTAKTLAILKFCLEKAKAMGKKRIIIVLPFLSVISQNAEIYRKICGNNIVLEDDSLSEFDEQSRMYADRWNSPIIVTTSVKFFETLFASKPQRLRRLHQLADSVIAFDECQTLPAEVLNCTLEIMQELTEHYHASVLFSTATLPAFQYRKDIVWKPREVMNDVNTLYEEYRRIKRTEVEYDTKNAYDSEALCDKFTGRKQALFVFNTVKKAKSMYNALALRFGADNCFAIMSSMCPQHKLDTIKEINRRLHDGEPCYVAATQCIEAGVDLDFPCGAREYAPYDSIIQTMGRINRNARYDGYMLVFRHKDSGIHDYPSAYYMTASNTSRKLSEDWSEDVPDLVRMDQYYEYLYTSVSKCTEDKEALTEAIEDRDFKKISDEYKLIDDSRQVTVIVPYAKEKDKFDSIAERLHGAENIITKRMMREAAMIKITSFKKDEVEKICEKLYLRTPDGITESGWYLLSDFSKYGKIGLEYETETVYII